MPFRYATASAPGLGADPQHRLGNAVQRLVPRYRLPLAPTSVADTAERLVKPRRMLEVVNRRPSPDTEESAAHRVAGVAANRHRLPAGGDVHEGSAEDAAVAADGALGANPGAQPRASIRSALALSPLALLVDVGECGGSYADQTAVE